MLADKSVAVARPASWAIVRHATEKYTIWEQATVQIFPSMLRDANACGTTPIVCGYTEAYRELWAGYFALCGLRRISDEFPAVCVVSGPLIGVTSGISAALALEALTGNAKWVVPLTVLGYADGLVGGIAFAVAFAERTARLRLWIQSHPLTSAAIVVGAAVACSQVIGAVVGAAQTPICLLNLVLGGALWVYLYRRSSPTAQMPDGANE